MTREEFLEDKAMVIAVPSLQNSKSGRAPHSDMVQMCQVLRLRTSPEYLASLIFSVEIVDGATVDMFADLEENFEDWEESDLEFFVALDSALSTMRTTFARHKELAASGANNGSNVIDFNACRRRRGLPVIKTVAA